MPEASTSSPSAVAAPRSSRSEEHTSELQSRQYLVCRLLLEKKNPHFRPLFFASQLIAPLLVLLLSFFPSLHNTSYLLFSPFFLYSSSPAKPLDMASISSILS